MKRDGVSETTNQHGATTRQIVEMSFIPEGDVYRLIAHSKLPSAERLDVDELTRIKFVSGGQGREMYCINESGLYNVILRSDKPEQSFKRPLQGYNETLHPYCRRKAGLILKKQ